MHESIYQFARHLTKRKPSLTYVGIANHLLRGFAQQLIFIYNDGDMVQLGAAHLPDSLLEKGFTAHSNTRILSTTGKRGLAHSRRDLLNVMDFEYLQLEGFQEIMSVKEFWKKTN